MLRGTLKTNPGADVPLIVILSEAKNLSSVFYADIERFFASLRMTNCFGFVQAAFSSQLGF
jgi:hypothetical protein